MTGGHEVAGSNPVSPTRRKPRYGGVFAICDAREMHWVMGAPDREPFRVRGQDYCMVSYRSESAVMPASVPSALSPLVASTVLTITISPPMTAVSAGI